VVEIFMNSIRGMNHAFLYTHYFFALEQLMRKVLIVVIFIVACGNANAGLINPTNSDDYFFDLSGLGTGTIQGITFQAQGTSAADKLEVGGSARIDFGTTFGAADIAISYITNSSSFDFFNVAYVALLDSVGGTTFSGEIGPSTFSNVFTRVSYVDNDFSIRTFSLDVLVNNQFVRVLGAAASAPVPTPATLALFGIGLAGLGIARRRRKQDS
jgi:PEP-CTERM motif